MRAQYVHEKLVDIAALFARPRLECEVVDDEQVDRAELGHQRLARAVETTLPQTSKHLVRAREVHLKSVLARDVSDRRGKKGFADADWPEHDDVLVALQEAKAHQLVEHALVVGDLRAGIPALDHHGSVEPGLLGASHGGCALASRHLVSEH
jgi:hypothetical protein